tara:strand:- start:515 stop:928 length:414 start_codon:yes stop_codon:yes gene_type:complete
MENLTQKYLNLLSEHETLQKEVESLRKSPMPSTEKEQWQKAYQRLYKGKEALSQEIRNLYKMWLPPRISSFFSTVIPWIKNGFKKSKFMEYRLSICNKCDLFTDNKTCQACGCFMEWKASIPQAKCPLDKWKADKPI